MLIEFITVNEEQDALGDAGLQVKPADCGSNGSFAGSGCHFQEKALASRFGGLLHGLDGGNLVIPHSTGTQEILINWRIPQRRAIIDFLLSDAVQFFRFRQRHDANRVARVGNPVVVEFAVGQEHVPDADAVRVLTSLFLAGQGRHVSALCLQHGDDGSIAVNQQVVSEPSAATPVGKSLFAVGPTRSFNHTGNPFPRFLFRCHCFALRNEQSSASICSIKGVKMITPSLPGLGNRPNQPS